MNEDRPTEPISRLTIDKNSQDRPTNDEPTIKLSPQQVASLRSSRYESNHTDSQQESFIGAGEQVKRPLKAKQPSDVASAPTLPMKKVRKSWPRWARILMYVSLLFVTLVGGALIYGY